MDANDEKYFLCFYVPASHTEACKEAIFRTGAGSWPGGLYSETCFVVKGIGQFRPAAQANPYLGQVGDLETVTEEKVEMICMGKDCVKKAIEALKKAHPYEVVAYYVIKSEEF